MSKYGPESDCADLEDLHPEKPGRILREKSRPAGETGYTVHARRPRSNPPGEWVDNGDADKIDEFDDSFPGLGQIGY